MHKELVKEIGEKELIKRISNYMPSNQTSDDCAFFQTTNKNLLINTDLMVENTHFNDKIISPKDLGWKSVAINYSDLISSGCIEPIGITIGLVLTPNTEWLWIKDLYEGFHQALHNFGGSILGGDCSRGENTIISITAVGTQSDLILRRHACKPGETLIATGFHGLSKLGFLIKSNQIKDYDIKLSPILVEQSIRAFSRPEPKYETLKNIIKARDGNQNMEIGCTDSSDGFYQGVLDLATESKCTAIIDYQKIPKNKLWPKGNKWDEYYFFGGEDYQLIFSLPEKWAENLLKIDNQAKEIGYFKSGKPAIEIINFPGDNCFKENNLYKHF